jgi:hypothetical protein
MFSVVHILASIVQRYGDLIGRDREVNSGGLCDTAMYLEATSGIPV